MATAGGATITALYMDEYLLAVDKPAGIIVHDDGCGTETLTDQVRAWQLKQYKRCSRSASPQSPGPRYDGHRIVLSK